jgi:hypothetical protein
VTQARMAVSTTVRAARRSGPGSGSRSRRAEDGR